MIIKKSSMHVCVCSDVCSQRCLCLQQDLLPSFTLPVCAVLLQPEAEHSCPVRPAANITVRLNR